MRLQATRTSVTSAGGSGDALYRAAGGRPTLDQRFAKDKSLVDKVSGQTLITFSRVSAGTYVDSNGIIQTASVNEARFDHDPVTGESLGLLIEEGRTNLLLNSSGDSNLTYWGRSSASRSVVDGPDGTNSAYQYLSAGGTVTTRLQTANTNVVNTVVGQQYALSCYVKGVNYDTVAFGSIATGFGGNTRCQFNLSTQTVISTPATVVSARIIPAGNGWYRLEIVTIAATSVAGLVLYLDLGNVGAEPHTTDEGFQAYGFQVEEGTFASSYISTTNAQVTRGPDNPVINTNLSSWYNQSSGTFVTTSSAVTNLQTSSLRGIFIIYQTNLAGSTFRHYLLYRGGNSDSFFVASKFNTANAFVSEGPGDPTYSKDTTAYGYSSSEISKIFYDGSFLTGSVSVLDWTTYTADLLSIGGSTKLNGHISRFTYFPTKRTDQELIKVSGGDTAIPIITYGITSTGSTFNLRRFADTVNYAVDWDSTGGYETSTSNTLAHTYAAGDYTLVVYSDNLYRPYFNNVTADVEQITSVVISAGANLGTSLNGMFRGGEFITSFECPFEATSNATIISNAFRDLKIITSFPLIDTSGCTSFVNTWLSCKNLTSFPLINTSNGLLFANAWQDCDGLVSFPQLNFSSSTKFKATWKNSNNLANFPANMFDTTGTLTADAFSSGWQTCALTAQSIENILVSLDTNGQSNITLHIGGGTNAAKTTWSTAANTAYTNLINKGWTITFNA